MLTLNLESREITGKKLAGERSAGRLPVVVYGTGATPGNYFVNTGEFKKTLKEAGESTIISLDYEGKQKDALIHDIQFHAVSGEPLHVDLLMVDANKPVDVSVELVFEGVAPAVKNLGGILVKVLHEVEISVLPKDLPHNLTVNLETLEDFSSRILAKDIKLPESAKLVTDPEEVVALANEPKEEEEETVAAPDMANIEVEKKGKEEEAATAEGGEKKE